MTDGVQTGNWQKVALLYDTKEVEKEVFRLWIDHGNAVKDGSYYYEIIPGVTEKDWQKAVKRAEVKVLSRSGDVHAVSDGNHLKAVFFSPGQVDLDKKVKLSADQGCLVMAEAGKKSYKFRVSAPDWKQETVELRLTGEWKGEGCRYDAAAGETEVTVPVAGKRGNAVEFEVKVE